MSIGSFVCGKSWGKLAFCIMVAIGTCWSPPLASAVTVTLAAGKVSTIFENQPNNSIGRGPAVFVGGDSTGSPRRGLIDFNVAANIPFGATITSASLTMYLGLVAEASGLANAIAPRLQIEYDLTPVPVPAAVWLFGSGLAAMVPFFRRKKTTAKV